MFARPTRTASTPAAPPAAPRGMPRALRARAPTLCPALVLSMPSAGAQGLLARRTFLTRISAPRALQCKPSRLARCAWHARISRRHPICCCTLRVVGWGALAGCGPCSHAAHVRQPWLAPSVRGAAASCATGLLRARHSVDRRRPACPRTAIPSLPSLGSRSRLAYA